MKRLILLRHAKSSWNHPEMRDFERPLNERGKRETEKMGARLRERGVAPDRIVLSPAVRAAQTAEIVAAALDYPKEKIQWQDVIYDASTGELLRCLQDLDDANVQVLLIGHNPGMSSLAKHLTRRDLGDMPTCGAIGLDLDVSTWGEVDRDCGKMIFHDHP